MNESHAEYTRPTTGGSMKLPTCTSALIAMTFAASATQAAGVNVLTAWYGQSCGAAHANVTAHVKANCDGKQTCEYGVDVNALGDAAPGCLKNFIVLYACQGQPSVRLSQLPAEASGKTISLSCARPEAQK